ncbi:MAG: heavy metal translocating P-type ATPase, partial [Clostridia bacterium]|nr:heavy metal translocating P-type ATPase [Clostridia bacterium]
VEEAAEKKGQTQNMITRLARVYTPLVVVSAVLIAVIGSVMTKNPSDWIYRALTFLVASCPCAIVISVPLGFYTGLGAAAKKGILVKGTAFVEAVAKARAVIFDKTGTLTTGSFEIETINPINGYSEKELLALAGAAEKLSSHPIAKSISAFAPKIDEKHISDFKEKAGNGASVNFAGKRVLCGSKKFLANEGVDVSALHENEICVSVDGVAAGSILMRSRLRDGAVEMIDSLKTHGIEHAVMLTGDNEIAAKTVVEECEIDEYHCNLLPEDKMKHLERIKHLYSHVIYVGDGINDAPVLAAADAGVAMGDGTQAAGEAGDIIITNNSLERFALAHRLFRRTHATVWFNILFALGTKVAVLLLGALGFAPIWLAVFADVGVCLICVAASSMIGLEKK